MDSLDFRDGIRAIGLAIAISVMGACSSSSTTPPTPSTEAGAPSNDAGTTPDANSGASDAGDAGDAAPQPTNVTVAPSTARVLTCDTLQFTETGGADGGAWSIAPAAAGSVTSNGLYAAPTLAPVNPAATVTYTVAGASGNAALTLGTAFPGTPSAVPIQGNVNAVPTKPFEAVFAASQSHVYADVLGPNDPTQNVPETVQILASVDNGKTFGNPTTYHTGNVSCTAVAADPGDSNVVYLVYLAGHGDGTANTGSTLRLAVSTDGAKTFSTEYVLSDSSNGIVSLICPDIVSPSPDHVIVAAAYDLGNGSIWMATYASGARGANIGPIGVEGVALDPGNSFQASSDTNSGSATTCGILSDGSAGSPRIVTNGTGGACLVFQHGGDPNAPDPNCPASIADAVTVQCSADNGATWTAPVAVGNETVANTAPTGALSPGGHVAVAYSKSVNEDAGSQDETFIVISENGGTTWSAPLQYPTAAWMAVAEDTSLTEQSLHWESDNVLWLSATIGTSSGNTIYIDKTCDFGATWSGPVTGAAFTAAGLVQTSLGPAAGGVIPPNAAGGPALSLVPLYP